MEFGRIISHIIKIEASANKGFLVTVGCGRFSYSSRKVLIHDLGEYLDNPEMFESRYLKKFNIPLVCDQTEDDVEPESAQ